MPGAVRRSRQAQRHLRFWCAFVQETSGRRCLPRLLRLRVNAAHITASGIEALPPEGTFILAVNHYAGQPALDAAAAVVLAAGQARMDALHTMLFVIGQRPGRPRSILRLIWSVREWVFHRWSQHVVRIALRNPAPCIRGLREWRRRAQPALIFPEGQAALCLGTMREGVGRWLRGMQHPVIPAAAWYEAADSEGRWIVRFGAPVEWSARTDLLDVQLGLALAGLLPAELAPAWQPLLARWRAVHHPAPPLTTPRPTAPAVIDAGRPENPG